MIPAGNQSDVVSSSLIQRAQISTIIRLILIPQDTDAPVL